MALAQGSGAKAISASSNHSCAILDDDSIVCWGEGDYGRLGNGDTSDQEHPGVRRSGIEQERQNGQCRRSSDLRHSRQ